MLATLCFREIAAYDALALVLPNFSELTVTSSWCSSHYYLFAPPENLQRRWEIAQQSLETLCMLDIRTGKVQNFCMV